MMETGDWTPKKNTYQKKLLTIDWKLDIFEQLENITDNIHSGLQYPVHRGRGSSLQTKL